MTSCVDPASIPPLEESLLASDGRTNHPSVERRYFSRWLTPPTAAEAGLVLLHSNRICLVCLAPQHIIRTQGLRIERLDFQVTDKINRLDNLDVRGKSKRGAQIVDEAAVLAWLECDNGERYPLRSQVRGKLLEINAKAIENPQILVDEPFGAGFLAIILPKLPEGLADLKTRLVGESEYEKLAQSAS
eukprot:maker-scaffold34_size539781-snap-gene-2.8 protein:Tk05356 transcript:maker-scaffold34_size539781-snap-gene-2.8-mRNA-1 annotation:"protein fam206a"